MHRKHSRLALKVHSNKNKLECTFGSFNMLTSMPKALLSAAMSIIPAQDFINKPNEAFAAFHFGSRSAGSVSRSVNGAN